MLRQGSTVGGELKALGSQPMLLHGLKSSITRYEAGLYEFPSILPCERYIVWLVLVFLQVAHEGNKRVAASNAETFLALATRFGSEDVVVESHFLECLWNAVDGVQNNVPTACRHGVI